MIDVIVPTYNAIKTINDVLLSLYEQTICNKIKVYIIDDNSCYKYDEIALKFGKFLNVNVLRLNKNMGPGYARNYGIKNTNSKYIFFMDSDDVLYNCYSLEFLYNKIEETNSDIVIGNFIEDYVIDKKIIKKDNIWVHGKIYRRQFLKENNINFNFSRANEDFGFNKLCSFFNPKIEYLNQTVYVWKYNDESMTRRNNHEYIFTGIQGFAYNSYWAVYEALKRGCDESKCSTQLFSSLYEIYFYYLKFDKIDKKLSKKILEWCFDLEKMYQNYKLKIEEREKNHEINRILLKSANTKFLYDILNVENKFSDFLTLIEKEGNKND